MAVKRMKSQKCAQQHRSTRANLPRQNSTYPETMSHPECIVAAACKHETTNFTTEKLLKHTTPDLSERCTATAGWALMAFGASAAFLACTVTPSEILLFQGDRRIAGCLSRNVQVSP